MEGFELTMHISFVNETNETCWHYSKNPVLHFLDYTLLTHFKNQKISFPSPVKKKRHKNVDVEPKKASVL